MVYDKGIFIFYIGTIARNKFPKLIELDPFGRVHIHKIKDDAFENLTISWEFNPLGDFILECFFQKD